MGVTFTSKPKKEESSKGNPLVDKLLVLPDHLAAYQAVNKLADLSYKVGFYNLTITAGSIKEIATFSSATPILYGDKAPEATLVSAANAIYKAMIAVLNKSGAPAVILPPTEVKAMEAPAAFPKPPEGVQAKTKTKVGFISEEASAKESKKSVDTVKLSKATFIGQKTLGSSVGSVYRVAGLGAIMNMSIRVKHNSISVRLEPTGPVPTKVSKKLSEEGYADHTGYRSMHFDVGSSSVEKVIGAVLMSVSELLEFKEQIKTPKEIM